jgi:hypothetical protein
MLLAADDTDESPEPERCAICCIVACLNCKTPCQDRLPVAVDADTVDSDDLEAAGAIFDTLDKLW